MGLQVVNRKGEKEDVRFDAILEKLTNLSTDLDPVWVDPAYLAKLVIEGLYDGVTTRELGIGCRNSSFFSISTS